MGALKHEFKVGDLICAFDPGFHRITKISNREWMGNPHNDNIYYVRVMTGDYRLVEDSRERCCDVSYCTKITKKWVDESRERDLAKWQRIADLIHD